MSDKIVDLTERQRAREQKENEEITALRAHVGALIECNTIVADAIERMWDVAERDEILKALRYAIEALELGED